MKNKTDYFCGFFKPFFLNYPAIWLCMTTAAVKQVLNKQKSNSEACLTNKPNAINIAMLI
jgi:hypothetical protein